MILPSFIMDKQEGVSRLRGIPEFIQEFYSLNSSIKSLCASPLFESIKSELAKFKGCATLPSLAELNQVLHVDGIQFVPQDQKSTEFEKGYEPRIYLKGEVQTRDQNWHDFFNALVWQQFPRSKKLISQVHYHQQKQRFPDARRTPAENMLALFDENGVVVISKNSALLEMLREHRWKELFWDQRQSFKEELEVKIFGHGLYEKCLHPFVGITGKALLFEYQDDHDIDTLLEQYLIENSHQLAPDLLRPLPILGIPGWWPDNEQETFYDNKSYFRDKR